MESGKDLDANRDIPKYAGIGEVVNVKEIKILTSFILQLKIMMRKTALDINLLVARTSGRTTHML